MRRGVMVALLLITVSLGAIMVEGQRPVNDEPTTLKESECYLCHSTGGGSLGPPLPLLYLLHGPAELPIPEGESAILDVGIENAWVSEIKDIVGVADVTGAPCLGFSSDKQAIADTLTGTVAAAASAEERSSRQTLNVEPGASDVVITLIPGSNVPPAMEMRIWTPGTDPDRAAATFTIDTADANGNYVYEEHDPKTITDLGVGEWTVDVVIPGAAGNPQGLADQPYSLDTFQDFRVTGEARQFTGTSEVLQSRVEEPSRLVYLSWTLTASCTPTEPTTLPVEVILVAHYAHGSTQISQYDDWRYTKTIELQVIPGDSGVIIKTNAVGPIQPVSAGFAWDILSEIIGYLSAVLILASIYTGGMFGKASRRQLNAVFGNAKRRVAFHNFLSYGILAAALIHTIIFLTESAYVWTLGIIWGGIAILTMIGLGVTGALQVPMIRRWNYAVWRWSHFYLSIGTIVFTIVHILLDGVHFVDLQQSIGWADPFA